MSDESEQTPPAETHDAGRRRFARLGAGVVPVVLTLAARPVLGTTTLPCLSSRLSGNLSKPDALECKCGKDPTYWKTTTTWPAPLSYGTPNNKPSQCGPCGIGWSGGTTFGSHFSSTPAGSALYNKPMRLVLCENHDSIEAHFVTALLNGYKDPGYSPRPSEVVALYANPASLRSGATRSDVVDLVLRPTYSAPTC